MSGEPAAAPELASLRPRGLTSHLGRCYVFSAVGVLEASLPTSGQTSVPDSTFGQVLYVVMWTIHSDARAGALMREPARRLLEIRADRTGAAVAAEGLIARQVA